MITVTYQIPNCCKDHLDDIVKAMNQRFGADDGREKKEIKEKVSSSFPPITPYISLLKENKEKKEIAFAEAITLTALPEPKIEDVINYLLYNNWQDEFDAYAFYRDFASRGWKTKKGQPVRNWMKLMNYAKIQGDFVGKTSPPTPEPPLPITIIKSK